MKVVYVYPNARGGLPDDVRAGTAPDTGLLGQNHLPGLGIETSIHDPAVRRKERRGGIVHRLTWNLRELALPWELADSDAAVTPLVNLFPLAARVRTRPRVIVLNYGVSTTWARASAARRRLLRRAIASSAAVVCLAEPQRQRLLDEIMIPPARVRVAHFGSDERFFAPRAANDGGYVLAVGKDLARDYATLADAARGLDARVVVVTDPRNLRDVNLPPNVEVRRALTWPELRETYAAASCVVLPLRRPDYPYGTEASGLTALLEAMAMAKPIVLTERDIFRDYVEPGASALAVPPEDAGVLRAAVERVLGDRPLRESLGGAARAAVEARFTSRLFAQRLGDVIRDVVA